MDDGAFIREVNKIFSEINEKILTFRARWSRPDPKGSTNKVISSSNLVESAIQNFPKFDRSDPKLWIRKCDRAFLLHLIPQDQKVLLASSQFEKKTEIWYQLVYARRVVVTWREFRRQLWTGS
ncbi:hypothetical protein Dsin_008661 [Dipteronia sinensis]|uniref:Uncharacterized protein n=1 Tax=Dipteronia sinensis TaxID=43782 RepID=A0AAE0AP09_9ROSI|nr:hypothetical protein Dsin_008661 [Dipteronia sinensis]